MGPFMVCLATKNVVVLLFSLEAGKVIGREQMVRWGWFGPFSFGRV